MALEFGKPVEWIENNMSFKEILRWWRYFCERPFGYKFHDLRGALNCAVMAAPYSDECQPLHFWEIYKTPKPEPKPEVLAQKIHDIFGGMMNG